jgi:hypothetical protein
MKNMSKGQFWLTAIGLIVGAIIGANQHVPVRAEASDIAIRFIRDVVFCGIAGALVMPIANRFKRWTKP